jgi:hypothetical protein
MSVALAVLLSVVGHNPSPIPAPVKIVAVGKVREVLSGEGGKPQAVLQLDDKSELVLHGREPTDDIELIHLAGVRVRMNVVRGDQMLPRGNHVRVDSYEILDIGGGVVPRIGVIAAFEMNGKQRLLFVDDLGRADLLPEGWSAKMSKHVGSRAWVVGTKEKVELIPTRFAILRPARTTESAEVQQ